MSEFIHGQNIGENLKNKKLMATTKIATPPFGIKKLFGGK